MANKHKQVQEWLAVYDELDPSELQEVEIHLQCCSECQEILADYRLIKQRLAKHRQVALVEAQTLRKNDVFIDDLPAFLMNYEKI